MIFIKKVVVKLPDKYREIQRPKFADSLVFPNDVTELTPENVSELHAKYTVLFTYANQELTKANVALLKLDTEEALRKTQLFIESKGRLNHLDRWRRDSVLEVDNDIQRIAQQRGYYRIQKEFAQMMVTNYDKYINALSRELSRRAQDRMKI